MSRIADEARRRSRIDLATSFVTTTTAAVTIYGISTGLREYADVGVLAVSCMIISSVLSFWSSVRERRRAEWIEATPDWWLHLDAAPEIRPFPTGFYAWADRIGRRTVPTWVVVVVGIVVLGVPLVMGI